MVFQEPMTALSLVHYVVGDQVDRSPACRTGSLDKKAAEAEAAAMLPQVGLSSTRTANAEALSASSSRAACASA